MCSLPYRAPVMDGIIKTLFVMRLTAVLLIAACLQVSANGNAQNISISQRQTTLEKVFKEIHRQAGYQFFYQDELFRQAKKFDISVKNASIGQVLDLCFKDQPFDYVIEDKIISFRKKAPPTVVLTAVALPVDTVREISGKITNEKGEPVSSATITVPGTGISMAASSTGTFTIRVPENKNELVITSIGYEETRVIIGRSTTLVIVMKEKTTASDDIVVIGYGVTKKSDLTGSVATVNVKDAGDRQTPDIATLLQGKVTGVEVNAGSIRIRGVTSFNNTDPLVVIDGFLGGNLSTINPNDIESMEVLKDASSTAIYGSRGANGVILVNTKSGKAIPLKVNININSGIATTVKRLNVLNATQYIDYVQEGLINAGQTIPDKLKTPGVRQDITNWQDEVLKTGHSNSIDVNLSGGTNKATFYVSLGYKHFDDIIIGPKYDQVAIRIKNDFKLKKWLKVGSNLAFTYRMSKGSAPADVTSMLTMPPYIPVLDSNNYWGYGSIVRATDLGDNGNPVASSRLAHPESNNLEYMANIYADITFFKGLVYHIQTGVTGAFNRFVRWDDKFNDPQGQTVDNKHINSTTYYMDPILESYLTYTRDIGKHAFSLMAGNTWQNFSQFGGITIQGQNYANTDVRNVFSAANSSITNEYTGTYAYESYFGRLNYQFNNKYLLTVNARRDGSPRFAPQHRWGTFPSVAVAWKMHEEKFIDDLNIFDQLKLRASWGISGNDAIGNFRYISQVWTNGVYYPLGTTPALNQGATIKDDASQGIKWESTTSKTLGLDMAFLRNKLTVTAEYFIKNSNDILFAVPRPTSLGYGLFVTGGDAIVNAASCVNKGFELQVGYRNKIGALNYSLDANYTHVNNNVTSLGLGQPYLDNMSRTDIDHPIGYFYGYVADGIFQKQADLNAANESARAAALKADPSLTPAQLSQIYYQLPATSAGDVRFRDLNGDGKISDDKDRTMIGNSIPKHYYGLSVYMDYKGFDLNVFFQGIAGSQLFYNGYQNTRGMLAVKNQETYVLDRWKSEQEPGNGIVPRAILGDPAQNIRNSTLQVESGAYFKLRQLSIGYNLPERSNTKAGFAKCRIYASASNVFTITKYTGYDPEYGGSNLNRGVQWLNFPPARSFSVGLQLGL